MYIRTENKIHYYKRDVKSGRIKTKRSYKRKKESTLSNELLLSKTAAIYSPTFTQYHRRGWA